MKIITFAEKQMQLQNTILNEMGLTKREKNLFSLIGGPEVF